MRDIKMERGAHISATNGLLPAALSNEDFAVFRRIAKDSAGILLPISKRPMVYTRFIRRLKALELQSFKEYLRLVESDRSEEYQNFVNTLTTNLTYFFREAYHFRFLREYVIPNRFDNKTNLSPVRIWSAGCSYGPEPYSIAITLNESGKIGGQDYRILCTDIDSHMVQQTKAGHFASNRIRGLDNDQLKNWFSQGERGLTIAKPELKAGMICKRLNLFDYWPIEFGVDVIFCRNVLIYFDRASQEKIIRSFASLQKPGHYLFLGHSESLRGFENTYQQVSNTVYQRI